MVKVIGLGEHAVSNCAEDIIKTYALSSCVALVIYNKKDQVLGMVHIVLPEKQECDRQERREGFFADTAVSLLFQKVFGRYPDQTMSYEVSLYGGSSSRNLNDVFNVGVRNLNKIESILKEQDIRYSKKDTGGCFSRTIEAYVADGRVIVRKQDLNYGWNR